MRERPAGDQMAIATPASKMSTAELLAALRAHYNPAAAKDRDRRGDTDPELLIEEVAAPGSSRRCDLMRIGVWPSRGQHIVVHELKVSRSDWLKELDDPAKAEAWWPYCHQFWVVAPAGLIDPAEVPDRWGLMVPPTNRRHRRFRIAKPAPTKTPEISIELLIEIVRRVDNARLTQIIELNRKRDVLVREQVTARLKERQREAASRHTDPDTAERLELLTRLEAGLGATLSLWAPPRPHRAALSTMSVDEVGTAFAEYTRDHVVLQRRAAEVDRVTRRLHQTVSRAAADLDHLTGREDGATTGPGDRS